MIFKSKNPSPIFLHNEEWIEYEQDNYWRRIDRLQNEFLVRLDPRLEPKFYAYFSNICKERRR